MDQIGESEDKLMQSYCCVQCGQPSRGILDIFLHIFSYHLHRDMGLLPVDSKPRLKLVGNFLLYQISTEQAKSCYSAN